MTEQAHDIAARVIAARRKAHPTQTSARLERMRLHTRDCRDPKVRARLARVHEGGRPCT